MEKLKTATAAAEKDKANSDGNIQGLQNQIDSQANRIKELLSVLSDREDALEVADREAKKSMDENTHKGKEAEMEIDTLKGELANCNSACDALTDELKVLYSSMTVLHF